MNFYKRISEISVCVMIMGFTSAGSIFVASRIFTYSPYISGMMIGMGERIIALTLIMAFAADIILSQKSEDQS